MMSAPGALSVLRNRNFLYLYVGGIISASGAAMASLTIVWLVYSQTGSAFAVAYLGLASVVPTIAFGLFAGALVDRFDRRKLMIASDLVRACAIVSLPIYLLWQGFSLFFIVFAMVLVGVFSSIFRPATNALLPRLVKGESVQYANGLISASNSLVQVVANAAGGILVMIAGASLGLFYNSTTYLFSALMIFMIVVPAVTSPLGAQETHRRALSTDIKEGLRFMLRAKSILGITIGSTFASFFLVMFSMFLVVYTSSYLMGGAVVYGVLLASLGFGVATGSLIVGRLKAVRYAGLLFTAGVIGIGLLILGLALVRSVYLVVPMILTMGFIEGLVNTTFFSIVQLVVPNEILGRVLSIDEVGSYAAVPLGQVAGGILTGGFGVIMTYTVAGFGVLATGIATLLLKDVRRLRYTPPSIASA